jgi:hypothetical protein
MNLESILNGIEAQADSSNEKRALPANDYNVKIEKVEGKKNEQTGTAGVNMQMRVFGKKFNNYVLFDYMSIKGSEQALKYSLPKLKKLGVLCGSEITDAWVNKTVNVSVGVDKNDPTKNIVWGYKEVQEADNTPVTNNTANTEVTADELPF